jgi:hypothetical protein
MYWDIRELILEFEHYGYMARDRLQWAHSVFLHISLSFQEREK